jgi:uncharacterized protein YecE (DUF72 family)
MAIRIGLGSWADDEYVGVLYPEKSPAKERLKQYAEHFNHAEVNSTYYAAPRANVTAGWVAQTPPGFTFDIKLHRAISASPLQAGSDGKLVEATLAGVAPLVEAKKLGVFFLVLEPGFGPGKHRLQELDELVQRLQPHALAVELRHSGWVDETRRGDTLSYFRERGVVWIAVDMPRIKGSTIMPPLDEVTSADLAYLRLHGRNPHWLAAKSAGERHAYSYPEAELKEIVDRVRTLAAQAAEVHVVANNHASDFAPRTALALRALLK